MFRTRKEVRDPQFSEGSKSAEISKTPEHIGHYFVVTLLAKELSTNWQFCSSHDFLRMA
jgi:hypothetical protein